MSELGRNVVHGDQVITAGEMENGNSSSVTGVSDICSDSGNSTKQSVDQTHNFVDEESTGSSNEKDYNGPENLHDMGCQNLTTLKSETLSYIQSNSDGTEKILPSIDMADRVTFDIDEVQPGKVETDLLVESAINKPETGACVDTELCDMLPDTVINYDIHSQDEKMMSDTEDGHFSKLQRSRVIIRKKLPLKTVTKVDDDEMLESSETDFDEVKIEESIHEEDNIYENRDDNVEIEDEMESEGDSDANVPIFEAGTEAEEILLQRFQEWVRIQGEELDAGFIDDLLFNPDDLDIDLAAAFPPKVNYPRSQLKENSECQVCLVETSTRDRLCCTLPVCDDCMNSYVMEKVLNGCVTIPCIGHSCNSNIFRDEVLDRLEGEMKDKYYQFLVDANGDPMVKTCPRCSHIYNMKKDETVKEKKWKKKKGVQVTCPKCALHWCFLCQAPWHKGMTCKEYNKGNKLLKNWAKEYHHGQNNAQKCPKCKVFIERRSGCDHMTCSKCATSFCYRCGERYISVKMIGDHHGRFSPFGCKYNLLPGRPIARRAVRGSILGAKVLGGVLLGPLIVAGGALVLATSVITLPIYGVHKYKKHRRRMEFLAFDRNYPIARAAAVPIPVFDPIPESGPAPSTESNPGDVESKATSTADATPDSESEAEHAQEVEVWVHYQHQGEQAAEKEVDEPTTNSADKEEAIVSTARISKDGNDTDILYVTTSYSNTKGQGCSEGSSDTAEKLEHAEPAKKICKGVEPEANPVPKKENESMDSSSQEPKGEVVTGDENSTSQGCFVQIFGKKLPVVWEKENKEINSTEDGKSVADKEGKFSTSSLEKKLSKSHSFSTESKRLKQRGHSTSEKLKVQPDIVQCSLHANQSKSDVVKPDFDSDIMPVVKHFPDLELDIADDSGSGSKLENEDIFMVIDCSKL